MKVRGGSAGGDGGESSSSVSRSDECRQLNVYELSHIGRDCQLTLKLPGISILPPSRASQMP